MDHLAFAAQRLSQGHQEGILAGGPGAGVPDWGLGLAPETASLLAAADEMTGVPQADLEQHQTMYVRYSSMQEAHQRPEWRQQDSLLAEATSNFGDPAMIRQVNAAYPLAVSMRLVQAPAAFARPMVQRKLFRPSFKVRLEIRFRGRLSLPVRVDVATMVDAQLAKPPSWKPDQNPAQAEIENTRIIRHIQVPLPGELDMEPGVDRTHSETFDFSDLRFIKSSRMSKRWLVFALRIKDDLLYSIYALPTVIVSRRTDQFAKALETLTGLPVAASASGGPGGYGQGVPPAKRPRLAAPPGFAAASSPVATRGSAHSPGPAGGSGGSASGLAGAFASGTGFQLPGGFGASLAGLAPPLQQLPSHQHQQQQHSHHQQQQLPSQQAQHAGRQAAATAAPAARVPPCFTPEDDSEDEDAAGGQAAPAAPVTADTVAKWVHRKYAAAGLTRRLGPADMAALEAAAGLPATRAAGGGAAAASPDDWLAFKDWFGRALQLLVGAGRLWEATSPAAIAGFAVTREAAEAALAGQPAGTFLLRLADEPGCLAISAGVGHAASTAAASVSHALLDGAALAEAPLAAAVLAAPQAIALLDTASGRLVQKGTVFGGRPASQEAALEHFQAFSQAGGARAPASAPQQMPHQEPKPASPPAQAPLVRPWARLGTSLAPVNTGNGGGIGGGGSLGRRQSLGGGGGGGGADGPMFEPLHLQLAARHQQQQAQQQAQQLQQLQQLGFPGAHGAAGRLQLEALAAQQGLTTPDFWHSGEAAAAAGHPAKQQHTTWLQSALLQQQQQDQLQGSDNSGSHLQPQRRPVKHDSPPSDNARRLESPRQQRKQQSPVSPGGTAIRPLARRMQAVVVPPCFCDADAPPGFRGHCC